VAGEHHRVVGQRRQFLQAVVHVLRVAARQVGASAALQEQGVAADQSAVDVEALAARCVPGGVHEGDVDLAHAHHIAGVVLGEVGFVDAGGAHHPAGLFLLHVDGAVAAFEQAGYAFDSEAHHRAAHMVGVIVGGEHTGAAHPIGLDRVEQFVDCVGRIDDDALARSAIADDVHEVDHLLGDRIADGEVVAGQELAEVEAIGVHGAMVVRRGRAAMGERRWESGDGRAAMGERGWRVRWAAMSVTRLEQLTVGQQIPFGGDRVTTVGPELAAAFEPGDRLVVVHETGDLLHIPHAEHRRVDGAVAAAREAFGALAAVSDEQISAFFDGFANRLADDAVFAPIAQANAVDVESAERRGRSTTRLVLSESMRQGMVDGLRIWQHTGGRRDSVIASVDHGSWLVETRRAPLGVVGFVFEGRPNVFADATGVLRTGNTAVFRIGSDALGTARAIMQQAVVPALRDAGLPEGAVQLVDSAAHAAGWALFADHRLGLAVARGSGAAVAQLGAVARQHGVPVSLHGTGGAWMVLATDADPDAVSRAVRHSLDRKVCNTLNVCCVEASAAPSLVPVVVAAAQAAAAATGATPVLHAVGRAGALVAGAIEQSPDTLGTEWEWERNPEFTIVLTDTVDDAVRLFNEHSPRFVASLLGGDAATRQRFYDMVDAPFVGNGFTRWVDGQFAFDQPELGLSNWQAGRLFARGGVLSGDSVFTVRTSATVRDHDLRR